LASIERRHRARGALLVKVLGVSTLMRQVNGPAPAE